MRQDEKAIFKYNGGLGALLCSKCRVIMKLGSSFNDEEISAIKGMVDMPPQYCKQCKPNSMTAQEKATKLVAMNELIALAETGRKLTMDERVGIAKRQAIETCNEVLGYMGSDRGYSFWVEVKQELEKI
jgi:hypothetical protein